MPFPVHLRQNLLKWKKFASQNVILWLQEGVHILFFKPPLSCVRPNHRLNKKEYFFVDSKIQKLLTSQVDKEVQEHPICVSIPKAGRKHRLILDLWWVNDSISTPSLRQSDITELRHFARPGDQFKKLDPQSGFGIFW